MEPIWNQHQHNFMLDENLVTKETTLYNRLPLLHRTNFSNKFDRLKTIFLHSYNDCVDKKFKSCINKNFEQEYLYYDIVNEVLLSQHVYLRFNR